MPLLIAIEILDLGDIFPYFLNDISINTCYSRVMAPTLSLFFTILKTTSLIVFILFASLALVDVRLLRVLTTKYISGQGVSGFIPFRVFLHLFCRPLPLKILGVIFLGA